LSIGDAHSALIERPLMNPVVAENTASGAE
jgi:hypothetical protein